MTTLATAARHTFRDATMLDISRLAELFEHFRAGSIYAQYGAARPDVSTPLIERLIRQDDGVVLVVEHDGQIVGMLGLLLAPNTMNGELMAYELFWWLEPEHRGSGIWLMRRAERWAIAHEATRLIMISPQSREIDRLYDTLGFAPVETSWQKSLDWFGQHAPRRKRSTRAGIIVHDDVLPDPEAYRAMALHQRFQAVQDGPIVFQRMAPCANPALMLWIVQQYPQLTPTLTFFRQGEQDQPEPHFVHTDVSMGEWTGILYLTPDPPDGDGTAFWKYQPTGAVRSRALTAEEGARWFNPGLWDRWHLVEAKFNRLVLFPSALYHSRAIRENYGHIEDGSARLSQNTFGVGRLS